MFLNVSLLKSQHLLKFPNKLTILRYVIHELLSLHFNQLHVLHFHQIKHQKLPKLLKKKKKVIFFIILILF